MQTVFPPSQDSIFGDTINGVPNPNVPHVHPYPTRYHGPNYTVPGAADISFVERPYARTPYFGFGAAPAPIFAPVSGSKFFDAALGFALGWVGSPKDRDKAMFAMVGSISMYAAGVTGLAGTGYLLYRAHKDKG